MTADPFESWLVFVWRPDFDGQPYHVASHDPGAGTAWGVTEATWAQAKDLHLVNGTLANAPRIVLKSVLRCLFWQKSRCGDMHPAIGGIVFDMAMLEGAHGAGKIVERQMGVPVDNGVIGPQTLKAINAMPPATALDKLVTAEEAYEDGLPGAKWFGAGWRRRAEAARAFARTFLELPGE